MDIPVALVIFACFIPLGCCTESPSTSSETTSATSTSTALVEVTTTVMTTTSRIDQTTETTTSLESTETEVTSPLRQQAGCGGRWRSREFTLTHPEFPGGYSNGALCRFVVGRTSPDACALEITFARFNLEASPGCDADFLAIGDERLCGRIPEGSQVEYPFEEDEVSLVFGTNGNVTKDGFQIHFKQIFDCDNDLNAIPAVHACDVLITDASGELVTHRTPGSKEPACRYTLGRRHSGFCQVELDFVDFNVDYSPGCTASYVQLDGHRFCGTALRGQRKNVTFDVLGNVHLVYRTDSTRTDRGFHLLFKQLTCPPPGHPPVRTPGGSDVINERIPSSCHKVFYEKEFYLESPGFPSSYDNNLDCQMVIRRYSGAVCRMDIRFLDFDVETSPGCVFDFLQVDGQRLCGRIPEDHVRTLDFVTFEKVLRFKTDSVNPRPGFFLYVRQLDCSGGVVVPPPSPSCDVQLWGREARLASPNYPAPYGSHSLCRYTVHREGDHICELRLTFLDFRLPGGSPGACAGDFLEMDGWRACGDTLAGSSRTLRFDSREKVLLFQSDGILEDVGFLARVEQLDCSSARTPGTAPSATPGTAPSPGSSTGAAQPTLPVPVPVPDCNRHFSELGSTFASPGYPEPYPGGAACRYAFHLQPGYCRVELTFLDFDLEEAFPACLRDYLEVGGIRYCGRQLHGLTKVESGSGTMVELAFRTEGRAKGFLASFRQRPCGEPAPPAGADPLCSGSHVSSTFEVRGPELGVSEVGQALVCEHRVRRLGPGTCTLRVTFVAFDLGDCTRHRLHIGDHTLCGRLPPYARREYEFREDWLTLRLSSAGLPRPRMLLRAEQLPCAACDQNVGGTVFELRSPLAAGDCRYAIHRAGPDICRLELTFERFDLPPGGPGCPGSHLRLEADDLLCGHLPPFTLRVYDFLTPEKRIHFRAEHLPAGAGFFIRGRQIPCNNAPTLAPSASSIRCDQSFGLEEFTVFSPNHPQWYPPDVVCRFVVIRSSVDVCALDITFLSFDLEDYYQCQRDYLDVDGERLCGRLPQYSTRHYAFHPADRTKVLVFRSDHSGSGPGFALRIRQSRLCQPARVASLLTDPGSSECEVTYLSTSRGEFGSPGCLFTFVQRKGACSVRLHFQDFALALSPECQKEYLEFQGQRYCGSQLQQSTREVAFPWSDSSTLTLQLVSPGRLRVQFEQIPCTNSTWVEPSP